MATGGAAPQVSGLRFEAIHHRERLHLVNPFGDTGIVTLWSPVAAARRRLEQVAPGILDPARSRVAVVANLYGDGMYAMFCNLLFNPQVRHLVAVGEDLGLPTCAEIQAFLERGLEDTVVLGTPLRRVRGTGRVFPAAASFDEARLRRTLSFRHLGRLSGASLAGALPAYLRDLPGPSAGRPPRRVRVEAAAPPAASRRPSAVGAHGVVRRRPLDCWEELVVRVVRFGHPVALRDGPRLELLNARAVITEPAHEPADALAAFGFDLDRLLAYQRAMLAPELPEGIGYTYGNRLRAHFGAGGGADTLAAVADRLRADPETRRGYVALWDTAADLTAADGDDPRAVPCLTGLFFRRTEGRLALTATYRAHNLLTAWLENVYGLIGVQRHVADAAGMAVGPITVVSHSLGIDPRNPRFELARAIAARWTRDDDVDRATGRHLLRQDPNGYFVVTVDEDAGHIVAEHRVDGLLVKRYVSDRADKLARQISGDMAVSLVSHALWLGRELAACEQRLRRRPDRQEAAR